MRKQLNTLLQYGVGIATIAVLLLAGLALFAAIGIGVITAKLAVFIK